MAHTQSPTNTQTVVESQRRSPQGVWCTKSRGNIKMVVFINSSMSFLLLHVGHIPWLNKPSIWHQNQTRQTHAAKGRSHQWHICSTLRIVLKAIGITKNILSFHLADTGSFPFIENKRKHSYKCFKSSKCPVVKGSKHLNVPKVQV